MVGIEMDRHWAMPNGNTFSIKPIREIVEETLDLYAFDGAVIIDPFANDSVLRDRITYTNDIDPDMPTTHHMDAGLFLSMFDDESVDVVLFDPPYSPRQVSECYKKMGRTVNMQTTQASFWSKLKNEIARIVKPGGAVLTCGWNSGGVGMRNGFRIDKIRLIAHGGWHNDTIVTREIKNK